jgi:hypothetical protein
MNGTAVRRGGFLLLGKKKGDEAPERLVPLGVS